MALEQKYGLIGLSGPAPPVHLFEELLLQAQPGPCPQCKHSGGPLSLRADMLASALLSLWRMTKVQAGQVSELQLQAETDEPYTRVQSSRHEVIVISGSIIVKHTDTRHITLNFRPEVPKYPVRKWCVDHKSSCVFLTCIDLSFIFWVRYVKINSWLMYLGCLMYQHEL